MSLTVLAEFLCLSCESLIVRMVLPWNELSTGLSLLFLETEMFYFSLLQHNVDVGYKFKCLIMEMMETSAQMKVESV